MNDQVTGPERYLSTREYCDLVGIQTQTARKHRMLGVGPPWTRFGNPRTGRVLYPETGIHAYMRERTFSSTAEEFVEHEKRAA